ncbi:MAG: hypothetical protein KDC57_20425 [Saprospiraceae bacterium]|nr:hypothetical protein [Saprospiraceae bacterium]
MKQFFTPKRLLAFTIGICYLWFGFLKFFPGLSPAEALAGDTINVLTVGLIHGRLAIVLLAIWEFAVGTALVFNIINKQVLWMAFIHMGCTFLPLIFFPSLSFSAAPFGLSLIGQYIIKNLVFISALLYLYQENGAKTTVKDTLRTAEPLEQVEF